MASVARRGDRSRLVAVGFQASSRGSEGVEALSSLAARHGLRNARCAVVLEPSEYMLVLTEAPPVGEAELCSALRWKIKDLIDFPVTEAVVDVFDSPSGGADARSVYAVAAHRKIVVRRVEAVSKAGLSLEVVDIPELAHRNLAVRLPEDAQGVALLSMMGQHGVLTLTRRGVLYFCRRLEVTGLRATDGKAEAIFDRVVLEVQRSLDYFESTFRESPINTLVLTAPPGAEAGLLEHLGSNLNVSVRRLDLAEIVECPRGMDMAVVARCLPAIGVALRGEAAA